MKVENTRLCLPSAAHIIIYGAGVTMIGMVILYLICLGAYVVLSLTGVD